MLFFRHSLLFSTLSFILFFASFVAGQVVFRELPGYMPKIQDHSFFEITQSRDVILLNGKWQVYPANEVVEKKVTINIPSVFEGEGEFIFERSFQLSKKDIETSSFDLVFLGLNYRADISINNVIIYRHTGGEFPFTIELSRDILESDSSNVLSVKLFYKLDSENTIPLKQRFLTSRNYGGIIHDVYLYKKPSININRFNVQTGLNSADNEATISFKSVIVDHEVLDNSRLTGDVSNLSFKVTITPPDSVNVIKVPQYSIALKRNKEETIERTITIQNPILWSPDNPSSHKIRAELWQGDRLIDIVERSVALYGLNVADNTLMFNGEEFKLKGVTYVPEFRTYGDLMSYEQFDEDIRLIKEAGFNAVRISKTVPHPYCLKLCETYGLIAFIEIPVGMLPTRISQDQNFVARCRYFVNSYINAYEKYSAVAALGLGSSFLASNDSHRSLLIDLGKLVKDNANWVTFASFGNLNITAIDNVDMYGLELLNELPEERLTKINQLQNDLGAGKVFLSEVTYTVNKGNSDGYVNKFSYEAQAKFFSDLIDYSLNSPLSGYFINSIFDIRGDYSSLLSGYNSQNIYNIGLVGEKRTTNRISFKVVNSKLNNTERITIPIGSTKDDAPMIFIIFGLLLALFMGILVNSGKKFREDASRALLRPYNYYADVRDQRIMSAYHTTFLAIIIVIVQALMLSNILFYLKTNIVFEKLLLSFGSPVFLKAINNLCWNPFYAIIWLTILGILLLLITTLIIKVASFFIRTRVYIASIYFAVIWAFLPMVFLIPLGIVLYRVLVANIVNGYIYFSLIVLLVWIAHRLLKGIYVIFDASPGSVYFYSILFVLFILGGILLYFEINNSAIQYMLFTFKQYSILS
jgi:beta-galactosidase